MDVATVTKTYPTSSSRSGFAIILGSLLGTDRFWSKKKEGFDALKEVSLTVKKGECVGIIGLNGAGKSTFLQIVAGTLLPNCGTVSVSGRVAALLELGSGFNPDFTGKENIYLNAAIFGLEKSEIEKQYAGIVDFADIGEFIDLPVRTYSSGMVVRLAFSIVAHVDAEVLIVDEALAVGDAKFQSKCFRYLESLKEKNRTLLFVSHDLNSVARLCDSSILLHEGQVRHHGKTSDVINAYSQIISRKTSKSDSSLGKKRITNPEKSKTIPPKPTAKIIASIEPARRNAILHEENSLCSDREQEFAYGGDGGEILEVLMSNAQGDETTVISSGDLFSISFRLRSKSCIESPIFAMTIRNSKGQQVYGQNTLFGGFETKDLIKDEERTITFRQAANLSGGEYLVSVGFTYFIDDELEVVHRRYDVIQFEVLNGDGSFGVANCFSEISCREAEES